MWTNEYHRDGYYFPVDVIDHATASRYRAALEDCEAAQAHQPELAHAKVYPHLSMPWMDELIRNDIIVEHVSQILGDNVLVWNSSFFIKEANTTSFVSWHQDLHYWGLSDTDEVTAWVALSPATVASGCMRFIAGTHASEDAPHRDTFGQDNLLSRGQELAMVVDDSSAVDAELQTGQMSLHHGRMFHASHRNQTDDRRIGVAIRYIKPSMRQSNGTRTMATLVKGEDTHGHFELTPPPTGNLSAPELERALTARRRADEILFETASEDGRRT